MERELGGDRRVEWADQLFMRLSPTRTLDSMPASQDRHPSTLPLALRAAPDTEADRLFAEKSRLR